jgi:hypothetical protein
MGFIETNIKHVPNRKHSKSKSPKRRNQSTQYSEINKNDIPQQVSDEEILDTQ